MLVLPLLLLFICSSSWANQQVPRHAPNPIINGTAGRIEDYPFLVSVQWKKKHKCGGTLINKNTVLTAAHCFKLIFLDSSKAGIRRHASVVVGSSNWKRPGRGSQVVKIDTVIWHDSIPATNRGLDAEILPNIFQVNNDFLLLKLQNNIRESSTVKFATLASSEPAVGSSCEVVGWGRSKTDPADMKDILANTFPAVLQHATMEVISNDACNAAWAPEEMLGPGVRMDASHVCVKQRFRGGKGLGVPCFGDSGGPLVCGPPGRRVVSGQVLGGLLPCDVGSTAFPIMYMRISAAKSFIQRHANK